MLIKRGDTMRKLINLSYCVKMFVCTMILSCALVIAISAIPINSLALAEDIITVELSVTLSGPRPTILPAGDNKEHSIGIGNKSGKAIFSDGQQADYRNVYYFDLFRGKGVSFLGYTKLSFEDNSWIFIKWESEYAGNDKSGNPMLNGTGKIIEGSGKYKGIIGTANFFNWAIPPNKDLPGGGRKVKATLCYRLPMHNPENNIGSFQNQELIKECETNTANAAKLITELGAENAFKEIVDPKGLFITDNSHVFCIDSETGTLLAHKDAIRVGYNMNNYKDADGGTPYKSILEKARKIKSEWTTYMTYGTGSERKADPKIKQMYFLKVPENDIVLCCGFFN